MVNGYFIEPQIKEGSKLDVFSNNKNFAFWLLDLQRQGASKVDKKSESVYNIRWELIAGENNFFELHGKLDERLLQEMQKNKTSKKGSQTDFFRKLIFQYLIENNYISKEYLASKNYVLDFIGLSVDKKNNSLKLQFLSDIVTLDGHNDASLNKERFLSVLDKKHKYESVSGNEDFFLQTFLYEGYAKQPLSPYDITSNYVNLFNYEYLYEGKNFFDSYIDFINTTSVKGKFKLVPTIAERLDQPISLEDGLGFSNFLRKMDIETFLYIQYHQQLAKYWIPKELGENIISKDIFFFKYSSMRSKFSKEITTFLNSHLINQMHVGCNLYPYLFEPFKKNHFLVNHYNNNIYYNNDPILQTQLTITPLLNSNSSCMLNSEFLMLYKLYWSVFFSLTNINIMQLFKNCIDINVCSQLFQHSWTIYYQFYNKILNIEQWKQYLNNKHYLNIVSSERLFVEKWYQKLKELAILRVDIGRNIGAFLHQTQNIDEEEQQNNIKNEEVEDDFPLSSNFVYKRFINDVYEPFLINPGTRPYKWLSVSDLQYSPFFYFFNNFKFLWFFFFDFFPHLSGFIRKDLMLKYKSTQNNNFLKESFKKLMRTRYLEMDDGKYFLFLKTILNSNFYSILFNDFFQQRSSFLFSIDWGLFDHNINKDFLNVSLARNLNKHILYMPKFLNLLDFYSNNSDYWVMHNWPQTSTIYASDWILNAEKRMADQLRLSFLYKIGINSSHFNFFSFMAPDFFERAVNYKNWMRFRTLDRVPDPENPFLLLDFFRPHTIELTADITLLKNRLDFLHLMQLGFEDVVFDKDIFVKNPYGFAAERRDIFEMPEYTVPFFFFDSDLETYNFTPDKPVYERVSSFGIPSLDRPWKIEEYVNIDSDKVDFDMLRQLEDEAIRAGEDPSEQVYAFLRTLWRKDQVGYVFSEKEINVNWKINSEGIAESNLLNTKEYSQIDTITTDFFSILNFLTEFELKFSSVPLLSSNFFSKKSTILKLQKNILFNFLKFVFNSSLDLWSLKEFVNKLSVISKKSIQHIGGFLETINFFIQFMQNIIFMYKSMDHYKYNNISVHTINLLYNNLSEFYFFTLLKNKQLCLIQKEDFHSMNKICIFSLKSNFFLKGSFFKDPIMLWYLVNGFSMWESHYIQEGIEQYIYMIYIMFSFL